MHSLFAALLNSAAALLPDNAQLPAGLPHMAPDASCRNWTQQVQGADRSLMRKLEGTWVANTVIPGTPGVLPDTPEETTITQWAEGKFVYEKKACFYPYGLKPACGSSIGHGEWFAHPAEGGWFFVGVKSQGSAYTGQRLPTSCGGGYAKFRSKTRTVTRDGTVFTKTGPAP